MNAIPQFLYVPKVNTLTDKEQVEFIIETRQNIYWRVFRFKSKEDLFLLKDSLPEDAAISFIESPHLVALVSAKHPENVKRLEKLTALALKWFVQFCD